MKNTHFEEKKNTNNYLGAKVNVCPTLVRFGYDDFG